MPRPKIQYDPADPEPYASAVIGERTPAQLNRYIIEVAAAQAFVLLGLIALMFMNWVPPINAPVKQGNPYAIVLLGALGIILMAVSVITWRGADIIRRFQLLDELHPDTLRAVFARNSAGVPRHVSGSYEPPARTLTEARRRQIIRLLSRRPMPR